ncbi:MAG TPA: hypothetical protein PL082_07925 [Tepidiformaceae bacterium]|jgi:hypothetical protein|nr:hypothetical protein [Tepidiformaceae bacterium]
MNIEVIEFELTCAEHGVHRLLVPVELPRPRVCAHCFLPAERREIRRFVMARTGREKIGGEAFIG